MGSWASSLAVKGGVKCGVKGTVEGGVKGLDKVGFKVGCRWVQGSTKVVNQGGFTSGVKGGLRVEIENGIKGYAPLGACHHHPAIQCPD